MNIWRRGTFVAAYLFAGLLALAPHDHLPRSRPDPSAATGPCLDPRPGLHGHRTPEPADGFDNCAVCQQRATPAALSRALDAPPAAVSSPLRVRDEAAPTPPARHSRRARAPPIA